MWPKHWLDQHRSRRHKVERRIVQKRFLHYSEELVDKFAIIGNLHYLWKSQHDHDHSVDQHERIRIKLVKEIMLEYVSRKICLFHITSEVKKKIFRNYVAVKHGLPVRLTKEMSCSIMVANPHSVTLGVLSTSNETERRTSRRKASGMWSKGIADAGAGRS